ncbi:chorismate mutase, partial [Mycobacterium sp. ITM-2017-0098]
MMDPMIRHLASAAVLSAFATLVAPAAAHAQPTTSLADLVDAAVRRLQVAEPIAANKFHTGGLIEDPAREQQVLDA